MTLGDLGEFGLIHRFAPFFSSQQPEIEGIGNDCAVIPYRDNLSFLITTDLLIEQTHFIKSQITPQDLAYKSLAVNLSDIAAMGGKPQYAFLSLGLPIDTSIAWIDAFFESLKEFTSQTNVLLLGGDTTRSNQVIINILLMGTIETSLIKRRSQAIPGDIICCTGYLGDSGAGLKILLEELSVDHNARTLINAHLRPRPHLEEGAWLASQPGVHAMMDVSDGLASDIQRIMEESHCGAHIEIDHLPLSQELQRISQVLGWQVKDLALTAGEDYCLLLTIDPKEFSSIHNAYIARFQRPLFPIGTILPTHTLTYTFHQTPYHLIKQGFDHFTPA